MTNKFKNGTLSTINASHKKRPTKLADVALKVKELLARKRVRYTRHANQRMGERNVIRAEVLQSLHNGQHRPRQDRFSEVDQSWAYSIEGRTLDNRPLRIGVSFEKDEITGELLLIITVIDLQKK